MKTWQVTRKTPDYVHAMTHETLTVRSYDDDGDAAIEILEQLGFEMTPCCEDGEEPCYDCARDARMDADGWMEDTAIEDARRREDEERVQNGGIEP